MKEKNQNASGDVFIAVGYGLEGAIPDAYAKRIIEEIMVPKFKEDDDVSWWDVTNILIILKLNDHESTTRKHSGRT